MTVSESFIERTFLLDQPVNIPRRLSEYKRDERTLFVATQKASYINVDSIGAEFVHLFEDGVSIRQAIATLKAKYGTAVDVVRTLGDLLVQIDTRGFYQHAKLVEDSFESTTMLARLTNRCNLRCTHCLVSSSPDWPSDKELSTTTWCSVLEDYSKFAVDNRFAHARVTITGGEALYRLDAFDILAQSKSLGLRTELYTNGVLVVNSRIASKIASMTDEVQISFDGATAPIHDQIRGAGMFARTLKGVRLLAEASARFHLAIVVMPMNFQDLMDNLPALVRSIPGKVPVRLSLAIYAGRAEQSMQFASTVQGEQNIKRLIERLTGEGVGSKRTPIPNLKMKSCGYARELNVDSDGLVYGCGPQLHPLGNIKEESFRSIADRVVMKSRRAEVDLVEGCKDCDIRYVCGGICRVNNMSRTGSATISSCDRANKESNIMRLFGRSSDIVPLSVLSSTVSRMSTAKGANSAPILFPVSALVAPNKTERRVE